MEDSNNTERRWWERGQWHGVCVLSALTHVHDFPRSAPDLCADTGRSDSDCGILLLSTSNIHFFK